MRKKCALLQVPCLGPVSPIHTTDKAQMTATSSEAGAVGEGATLCALTVGRQKTRLRGSRHTNPRYPTRPKDIPLENLEGV